MHPTVGRSSAAAALPSPDLLVISLQELAHTATSLAHGLGADAAAALPDAAAATAGSCPGCSPLHDPGIVVPAQAAADAISAPLPDNLWASISGTDGSWPLDRARDGQPVFSLADAAAAVPARTNDWLSPISDALEWVLTNIKTGLARAHVPYSYGWAIVGLTLCTKTLTYPLTKIQVPPVWPVTMSHAEPCRTACTRCKPGSQSGLNQHQHLQQRHLPWMQMVSYLMQVESALAVQNLKPTIDAIKAQYGEDKRKIQRETTELYKQSGVNPLASRHLPGVTQAWRKCRESGPLASQRLMLKMRVVPVWWNSG